MIIPWRNLRPDTLSALIEEFITRDGTDYGMQEASLDTKLSQVMKLLEKGEIEVVFDAVSETCDLREARSAKDNLKKQAETPSPDRDSFAE